MVKKNKKTCKVKKKNNNKYDLKAVCDRLDLIANNQESIIELEQIILTAVNDIDYTPNVELVDNKAEIITGLKAVCKLLNGINEKLTKDKTLINKPVIEER